MGRKKFWHEIEGYDWKTVRALEWELFKKELEYVYGNSPFYQKKFAKARITPDDIKTRGDLHKVPFTYKEEIRDSLTKFPPLGEHGCVPINKLVRIQASSGTTGKPKYNGLTKNDLYIWNETTARQYYANQYTPGEDVSMHLFTMSKLFGGAVPMQDGIEYMGVTQLPMGAESGTERILDCIKECNVTAFTATPNFALYLGQNAKEVVGVDACELSVKKLALGGEPGVQLHGMRERLENIWGAKVYELMGMGDFGETVAECQEQNHMHITSQGIIYIELVDPETDELIEFKEGAEGELIYSALNREASPLVWFKTGDRVVVHGVDCRCGRTSPRIQCVGRTDDMLIIKGINVFPSALRDVAGLGFQPKTTGEIRIVLEKPEYSFSHPVKLKVEVSSTVKEEAYNDLKRSIERRIKDRLNCTADVLLVKYGELTPQMGATMKVNYFEKEWEKSK